MDAIVEIINKLALIVPILLAIGAGWKYLPFLRKLSNDLIPLVNSIAAFFVAFGGGAQVAHAGIFGDIGRALSIPGQIAASVILSYFTSLLHDKVFKPITPKVA